MSDLAGFQNNSFYKWYNPCSFTIFFLCPLLFPSVLPVFSFLYEKCTAKLQCYSRSICSLFLSTQETLESLLFSFFPIFRKKRPEKDGFEQQFGFLPLFVSLRYDYVLFLVGTADIRLSSTPVSTIFLNSSLHHVCLIFISQGTVEMLSYSSVI